MGTYDRLLVTRRVVTVIQVLEHCRSMPAWSVLADHLDASERTAKRYVEALEHVGWPLPPRKASET